MTSRKSRAVLAAAVAFLFLCLGGAGYLFKTLGDTRQQLAETRGTLDVTQTMLSTARQTVIDEKAKSADATNRIASLDQDVLRVNAEIAAVQAQLASSNATVETQKGDVVASQKCLDGVTGAVVSAANRNTGEAEGILKAAKADCDRAYAVK